MKRYVCNVFTLGMCNVSRGTIRWEEVSVERARELARDALPAIGHDQTAKLASESLAFPVPFNRVSVKLEHGDELLVYQYVGPRLPEGVITLPEGAEIHWIHVVHSLD